MRFTEKGMTFDRLDEHLRNAVPLDLNLESARLVCLSDAHKWDRTEVDLFNLVERVYLSALDYYHDQGFTLVLLGDIEEGAGDRLRHVLELYPETFSSEAKFLAANRYWRVYGNHDHDWKKNEIRALLEAAMGSQVKVYPALRLGNDILIVHGHEGDLFSDELHGFTQILLRAFKKLFERIQGHSAITAENSRLRDRRAKLLYRWARRNGMLIIAGHTHSAFFESLSLTRLNYKLIKHLERKLKVAPQSQFLAGNQQNLDRKKEFLAAHDPFWKRNRSLPRGSLPLYFNTGCCKYDDGLTGIEIADGNISLIKWTSEAGSVPERGVLASRCISDIFKSVARLKAKRRDRQI